MDSNPNEKESIVHTPDNQVDGNPRAEQPHGDPPGDSAQSVDGPPSNQGPSAPADSPADGDPKPSAAELKRERKRQRKAAKKQAKIAAQVMPFQSDAVELEYRKVAGGARWTLYIAIALLCSAVGWACWAKIDKIVISNGELVPVDTPIVVQPVVSAPIKSIAVREFDRVLAGQKLAELDPTFTDSDISQLSSDISKAEAKIARLESELKDLAFEIPSGASADMHREYSNYLLRKTAREAKLAEFQATIDKLKIKNEEDKRLEEKYSEMESDFRKREQTYQKLVDKQSAPKEKLQEIRLQVKRYNAEVIRTQGQQRQTSAELKTAERSRDSYTAEWKAQAIAEQIEAQKELDKAKEALTKAQYNKERSTIYVPEDTGHEEFYVIQIAEKTVGSVVQVGEPLMRLMPIDAELEAEVEIQGKDIGQLSVEKDLKVRVKLTSFEFQKFGTLDGKIRTISEGTVQKESPDGQPAVSVYKARITIDFKDSKKFNKPKNFKPLPGMAVITDIRVGERRVIEYFLYPFLKHLDVAAREP